MEKLIYTAASGAELNQAALRVSANNLANVSTPGFKADIEQATALMIRGSGFRTRYQAQVMPVVTDLASGPVQQTGRELDIALSKDAFLAVQDRNGQEAYTRAGSLQIDAEGNLKVNGYQVMGLNGPIQLPEFSTLDIGSNGTMSTTPIGGGLVEESAQLKLADRANQPMVKGLDGLLRPRAGGQLEANPELSLKTGALEGSNVNAIDEMVNTMAISREFEMNVRMMKAADELASSGNQLIRGA